jgi:putative addiction module component (TIGR02574 family)
MQMPRTQRWLLAERLLDTLDPPEVVDAAWEKEIARRIEDLDSGRVKAIPAEEVHRGLEAIIRESSTRRIPPGRKSGSVRRRALVRGRK